MTSKKIDWHYFGKKLHAVVGGVKKIPEGRPVAVCGMVADGWSCEPFNDEKHIIVRCKKCSKKLGTEVIQR